MAKVLYVARDSLRKLLGRLFDHVTRTQTEDVEENRLRLYSIRTKSDASENLLLSMTSFRLGDSISVQMAHEKKALNPFRLVVVQSDECS